MHNNLPPVQNQASSAAQQTAGGQPYGQNLPAPFLQGGPVTSGTSGTANTGNPSVRSPLVRQLLSQSAPLAAGGAAQQASSPLLRQLLAQPGPLLPPHAPPQGQMPVQVQVQVPVPVPAAPVQVAAQPSYLDPGEKFGADVFDEYA